MSQAGGETTGRLCGIDARGSALTRLPARHSAEAEGVENNFRLHLNGREIPFSVAQFPGNRLAQYFPVWLQRWVQNHAPELRLLSAGDMHYPESLIPFHPPSMPVLRELMRSSRTPFFAMRGRHQASGWVNFRAEPSFVMPIPADWESLNDYQNSLQSKYRVRMRRVFRLTADYSVQRLSKQEFLENRARFRALLEQLHTRIGFYTGELSVNFFAEQFDRWGDDFSFMVYKKQGEPAGFITVLIRNGMCYALHACAGNGRADGLYPRMLFDTLGRAVDAGCTYLHLGKTAPEIKSSLGAVPQEEWVSVYTPCLCRRVLLLLATRFTRLPLWVKREPFREQSRVERTGV